MIWLYSRLKSGYKIVDIGIDLAAKEKKWQLHCRKNVIGYLEI